MRLLLSFFVVFMIGINISFAGILTPDDLAQIEVKKNLMNVKHKSVTVSCEAEKQISINKYEVYYGKIKKIRLLLDILLELDEVNLLIPGAKTAIENKIQVLITELP